MSSHYMGKKKKKKTFDGWVTMEKFVITKKTPRVAKCKDNKSETTTENDCSSSISTINTDRRKTLEQQR